MAEEELAETLGSVVPANRGFYRPRGCTPTRTFETRPRRFGHVQRRDSDAAEAGDREEEQRVIRYGNSLEKETNRTRPT